MKDEKIERDLMSQEEFEDYLFNTDSTMGLTSYDGVHKFKSIGRAIRRGHLTHKGIMIPKRPFHNKANSCKRKGKYSRSTNELKKEIYGEIKQYQNREY